MKRINNSISRFITTMQEVEDLVRGVTFFGTGGGGYPVKGSKFLKETLIEPGPYARYHNI